MFITLTTDFGTQSHGVGMMEAVIAEIAPQTRVIHYMHGIEDHDTMSAARVLETVQFIMPAIHVCICDPGVGTVRRPLAILTHRGDVIIGPDNGVLLPAVVALGGAIEVREISNPAVMCHPISAVFHGRDVFCPAAAQLANGLRFELVGEPVDPATLAPASFSDAARDEGRWIARVIHIDKFGNAHLNIARHEWRSLGPSDGCPIDVVLRGGRRVAVAHHSTFGDVQPGQPVMLAENDGRPALAVNRGSFAATYEVALRDDVIVEMALPPKHAFEH